MAPRFQDKDRLLRRALVISLLAHGVLLLQPGFGGTATQVSGMRFLGALLTPRMQPEPLDAVAATRGKTVGPGTHVPSQENEAVQGAAPVSRAGSASPDGAANPDRTRPAPSGAANTSDSAGFDFAEGRKSYLFAIAAEARRIMKHRPKALLAGWTGTVGIRISVAAGGKAQPPQVSESSGHDEIDKAALAFVRAALKDAELPENMRGQAFDFVVPVVFGASDE